VAAAHAVTACRHEVSKPSLGQESSSAVNPG
jgi:hypothetical protein